MLSYPVRVVPVEGGKVELTFPDVPEAVSRGETEDLAFALAPDVLDAALDGYKAQGRPIPSPSDICGAPVVATRHFQP